MPDQSAYQQAIGVALNDAKTMLGKNEVPNRSEIVQYLHDGGQDLDPHKVAWCAAFVSASLQKAGLPVPTQVVKDSAFGPGAYAPNYLTYGSGVAPKDIQAGDIIVANTGGHVGFAEGPIRNGPNGPEVQLLAGNEQDPSGRYAPGSYTNPQTGAVAKRSQVGMVGERWVPLSQYSARRYEPQGDGDGQSASTAPSPSQSVPGTTLNSNVIDTLSKNIAQIESGTFKNPYTALGPVVSGRGQAVGKYQVMPENIPGWTLAATGKQETVDQFRNDPAAQEAVFRDQMQRSLQLYSPRDAASIWFTGKPYSLAGGGATDKYTTNASYVARATQGIDNPTAIAKASGSSQPAPGGPQTAQGAAPTTPGAWGSGQPQGALASALQPLNKALGLDDKGQPQAPEDLKPGPPPSMDARAVGGAMMAGPGGANVARPQMASQQALMQQGFMTSPVPANMLPSGGITSSPVPIGTATGLPGQGLPGTTLNSPSQLQMAMLYGFPPYGSSYGQPASPGGAGSFSGSF